MFQLQATMGPAVEEDISQKSTAKPPQPVTLVWVKSQVIWPVPLLQKQQSIRTHCMTFFNITTIKFIVPSKGGAIL